MRHIPDKRKYHNNEPTRSSIRIGHREKHLLRFFSHQVRHIVRHHNILRTSDTILHGNRIKYKVQNISINCSKLLKHTSALDGNTTKTRFFRDTAARGPYEPKPRFDLSWNEAFTSDSPKKVIQPPKHCNP